MDVAASLALPEPHRHTPTGRPSWYGSRVGVEERSWLSKTGDVGLFAGNSFPTSFTRLHDAVNHARAASAGDAGAVVVMRAADATAHGGMYWLARAYNAEYLPKQGLVVGQTSLAGDERFSRWNPEVRAVVDDSITVRM